MMNAGRDDRDETDPTVGDGPDESDDSTLDEQLNVVLNAYALKDEHRTGWQLRGVEDPESVAAHSWGVAYLVLALGDRFRPELPDLDFDRALRLAVVHDVAEAETGDLPTRADETAETIDKDAKLVAERSAMATLVGPLPDRIHNAWETYEARDSPEAILVKECDLLDTCLQAVIYERDGRYDPNAGQPAAFQEYEALDEFFVTAESRIQTALGRKIFERLRDRYRNLRQSQGTYPSGQNRTMNADMTLQDGSDDSTDQSDGQSGGQLTLKSDTSADLGDRLVAYWTSIDRGWQALWVGLVVVIIHLILQVI